MIKDGYEIDFIPVDSGEKNGDAITVRIRHNFEDTIYVIDGGTKDSGQKVVDHIKKHYNTDTVDYMINTHPDSDHISGLTVVAEQLKIKKIWMHKPWEHAEDIISFIEDNRITENSLEKRIQESLKQAKKLNEIADEQGIPIHEPFEGNSIGDFTVLSPSEEQYIELLKKFNGVSNLTEGNIISKAFSSIKEGIKTVFENWDIETLSEDGETSAQNESSTILYSRFDKKQLLFTGDAGRIALDNAYFYAKEIGIDLKGCNFIQIPHHGGRRNVTPSLLNKIIGPKLPEGSAQTKTAFVNVSKDNTTHPKKSVVNAFIRRGVNVSFTKGQTICSRENFNKREGWVSLKPIEFSNEVEE